MNPNHNRKWWMLGAALIALYFAPQAVKSFKEASGYQERIRMMQARAQAARPANTPAVTGFFTPPAAPAAAGAPVVPVSRLAGVWAGQQGETNRELCRLQVEIRDKGANQVNGYVKMLCYPTAAYYQAHPKTNIQETFLKAMTPMAAILSGPIGEGGVVSFHVEKVIGLGLDGCPLSSFKVTPFGSDEIAAEWEQTGCPGGQMTLSRSYK